MIKPLPLYDGHLIGPGLVLHFRMLMFSVRTLSKNPADVEAVVLPYHLVKIAGLVQSFYIPTGYFSPHFRFQAVHSWGVSSPQGLVDIRHLSIPLASIIFVITNDCFWDVGYRKNTFFFTGWGCWPQAQFSSFTRAWERLDIPILDWIYPGRVIMGLAVTISLQLNSALSVRSIQVIKESTLRWSNHQIL